MSVLANFSLGQTGLETDKGDLCPTVGEYRLIKKIFGKYSNKVWANNNSNKEYALKLKYRFIWTWFNNVKSK